MQYMNKYFKDTTFLVPNGLCKGWKGIVVKYTAGIFFGTTNALVELTQLISF